MRLASFLQDVQIFVAGPPATAELLVLGRSAPFVTHQLGAHLGVAVLHEVVQGKRTSVLFRLVVAVAWQVVLAGDVVALKLPFVLDLIHGNHTFLKDPSCRKSSLLHDVNVQGGIDVVVS